MENNKIIIKYYFESKVTIIDKDKAAWFKACDVATILGYGNSREAMKKHIDMEDKKKMNELMPSRNGTPLNSQPHTIILMNPVYILWCLVREWKLQKNLNDGFQRSITKYQRNWILFSQERS
jgi:prophage antirepressor-like protein